MSAEHVDYWETLNDGLVILDDLNKKLHGYAYTSEGENVQKVNDLLLEAQALTNEMVEELVDG